MLSEVEKMIIKIIKMYLEDIKDITGSDSYMKMKITEEAKIEENASTRT